MDVDEIWLTYAAMVSYVISLWLQSSQVSVNQKRKKWFQVSKYVGWNDVGMYMHHLSHTLWKTSQFLTCSPSPFILYTVLLESFGEGTIQLQFENSMYQRFCLFFRSANLLMHPTLWPGKLTRPTHSEHRPWNKPCLRPVKKQWRLKRKVVFSTLHDFEGRWFQRVRHIIISSSLAVVVVLVVIVTAAATAVAGGGGG